MSPLPPLLLRGDCIEQLKRIPDNSVDSVVTDPPYNLTAGKKGGSGEASVNLDTPYGRSRISTGNGGFMGHDWDDYDKFGTPEGGGFQHWCEVWARECLRILQPGGHLLAFGGTRTFHRLAAGIEDAGFEIRDSLAWLYGSGFPKSLDVSKAIDKAAGAERERVKPRSVINHQRQLGNTRPYMSDPDHTTVSDEPATEAAREWQGWGTALKPAFEPVVVARKPLIGTVAANVLAHGTGALNIDASRIGSEERVNPAGSAITSPLAYGKRNGGTAAEVTGRWPANVLLDESQAAALDAQSGKVGGAMRGDDGGKPSRVAMAGGTMAGRAGGFGDSGGASRFFFVARREGDTIEPCDHAANAAPTSDPRSVRAASAPGDAATSAPPAVPSMSRSSSAPSTNGTGKKSKKHARRDTPMTQSIGAESSRGLLLGEPTPNGNHAESAAAPASDTTKTTADPSTSFGFADRTTSAGTSSSTGLGGQAFLYHAKAPKSERPTYVKDGAGNGRVTGLGGKVRQCNVCESRAIESGASEPSCGHSDFRWEEPTTEATSTVAHPTVKPLTLMRWLVKLVTPPGGTVVDPFAGSGTTMEAAYLEGFECIGVELTPDYWPLIESRIARVTGAS